MRQLTSGEFLAREVVEASRPLRSGQPGVSPFWNKYAKRFLYAPAFDLPTVEGAVIYKFTATPAEGQPQTFKANVPWAALTPIWDNIPHGLVSLKVEGMDSGEAQVLGVSGEVDFYRAPLFNGPYHEPAPLSYSEAGQSGLRGLYLNRRFQHWLTEGKPDPEMFLNCFASKEMGAMVRAMAAFSKVAATEQEAKNALVIARRIADFLISLTQPEGKPLADFPPVYWINPENVFDDWHFLVAKDNQDKMMLSEPVRAAFGYLDLYDVTKEERYLDAAVKLARTYVRIQRADGTWPLLVNIHTAEELESKPVIPTWILFFFERLVKQYHYTEFSAVSDKLIQWIIDNPVKGFHWDAQFEDVKIKVPYRKMAYEQAADTAYYLLSNANDDASRIQMAEELLRFVEDQFIVWEQPTDGWKKLGFPGGPTKYSQYAVDTWITPAVIEQFGFVLVARATAVVMRVFAKAYEVTGKKVYMAKARSLANTLVVTQQYHGGGEIPSFPMTSEQIIWTNNSVYTALFLIELGSQIE
jgi:hypothetical protein